MLSHLARQNLALALSQKRHFGGDSGRAWGEDFWQLPLFTFKVWRFHKQSCSWYNSYIMNEEAESKLSVSPFKVHPIKQTGSQPTYFALSWCRSSHARRRTLGGNISDGDRIWQSPSHSRLRSDKWDANRGMETFIIGASSGHHLMGNDERRNNVKSKNKWVEFNSAFGKSSWQQFVF